MPNIYFLMFCLSIILLCVKVKSISFASGFLRNALLCHAQYWLRPSYELCIIWVLLIHVSLCGLNALEEKIYLISWTSGFVKKNCFKWNTKLVNTLKLNSLALQKATIDILYNSNSSEVKCVLKVSFSFSFLSTPNISPCMLLFFNVGKV
jgi:hypothetical protein